MQYVIFGFYIRNLILFLYIYSNIIKLTRLFNWLVERAQELLVKIEKCVLDGPFIEAGYGCMTSRCNE